MSYQAHFFLVFHLMFDKSASKMNIVSYESKSVFRSSFISNVIFETNQCSVETYYIHSFKEIICKWSGNVNTIKRASSLQQNKRRLYLYVNVNTFSKRASFAYMLTKVSEKYFIYLNYHSPQFLAASVNTVCLRAYLFRSIFAKRRALTFYVCKCFECFKMRIM